MVLRVPDRRMLLRAVATAAFAASLAQATPAAAWQPDVAAAPPGIRSGDRALEASAAEPVYVPAAIAHDEDANAAPDAWTSTRTRTSRAWGLRPAVAPLPEAARPARGEAPLDRADAFELPWRLRIDARNAPTRLRRGLTGVAEAAFGLARPFGERARAGLHYQLMQNEVAEDAYDFERHVFGVYLSVDLGGD